MSQPPMVCCVCHGVIFIHGLWFISFFRRSSRLGLPSLFGSLAGSVSFLVIQFFFRRSSRLGLMSLFGSLAGSTCFLDFSFSTSLSSWTSVPVSFHGWQCTCRYLGVFSATLSPFWTTCSSFIQYVVCSFILIMTPTPVALQVTL